MKLLSLFIPLKIAISLSVLGSTECTMPLCKWILYTNSMILNSWESARWSWRYGQIGVCFHSVLTLKFFYLNIIYLIISITGGLGIIESSRQGKSSAVEGELIVCELMGYIWIRPSFYHVEYART